MNDFRELNLSKEVINDLGKQGIIEPTIVQSRIIPLILNNKDVLVQSETGSGKTIGFAAPTIDKLKPLNKVQVLVLTPTRELAQQVGEEYIKFSRSKRLKIAIVYGGVSIDNQSYQVRQADIVIGTPGRIQDLINRRMLNLSYINCLVIDEADRLMDMGFIDDLDRIISFMPKNKQNLFFSATINDRVINLAYKYLNNPSEILMDNVIKSELLTQYYYNVNEYDKLSLLVHILNNVERDLTLIFCNTKRTTKFVADVLNSNKIKAAYLNGDLTQHTREHVMKDFSTHKTKVLVATDVAARGIHVDDITHVINYDLHEDVEMYTHRIGRTARNGKKGTAITLLSDRDWYKMDRIMSKYREQLVEQTPTNFQRISILNAGRPKARGFQARRRQGRGRFNRR